MKYIGIFRHRHQRSAVRIELSVNFIYYQMYCKNENKEKEAGNGQNIVQGKFDHAWVV